jgi:putative ABC transport system substrate-binding protein
MQPQIARFRQGLAESGYIEGHSVIIEYRWGRGLNDELPRMAAELLSRPVNVLVAGSDPAALAAKAATLTVPIVFAVSLDPVKRGLVASFNRPGGNATGLNFLTTGLEAKRLGLLHDLVPHASTIGMLVSADSSPGALAQLRDLQEAARIIGAQAYMLRASNDGEIDSAFDTIAQQRIDALVVTANPFYDTRRGKILELAERHTVPAIYQFREYTVAGGLMSYGIDLPAAYYQIGVYAARILKGTKPADLPVMQATKFELVINAVTARALGIEVPPTLLAIADEVIE